MAGLFFWMKEEKKESSEAALPQIRGGLASPAYLLKEKNQRKGERCGCGVGVWEVWLVAGAKRKKISSKNRVCWRVSSTRAGAGASASVKKTGRFFHGRERFPPALWPGGSLRRFAAPSLFPVFPLAPPPPPPRIFPPTLTASTPTPLPPATPSSQRCAAKPAPALFQVFVA